MSHYNITPERAKHLAELEGNDNVSAGCGSLSPALGSAVPITAHRLANAIVGALRDHDGSEPLADYLERKLLEWGCPARAADIPPHDLSKCARLPFRLTIYDESGTHTVSPLWLDVPVDGDGAWEPVPDDFPGGHWEHVARMEKWAKEQILAGDIECSLDTDTLCNPPNGEVRHAGSETRPNKP